MDSLTPTAPRRKAETGLVRGQAAKIARIHRVTIQHVVGCASGKWNGRPALMRTIAEYRARNAQQQPPQHCDAA